MSVYYNENNPFAAQWLRNLIAAGLIADGVVDERDIRDVRPEDLKGYTQCHFFAGIGGWSHALRLAGWPDDRPVWTGSCPCQPFSQAGRRAGTTDERHLWPAFFHLIRECRPDIVFGEQVASKDGISWLNLVSSDLESENYTCGPIVLPACGFGAPHLRQRLWFAAHSARNGRGQSGSDLGRQLARSSPAPQRSRFKHDCKSDELANSASERCKGDGVHLPQWGSLETVPPFDGSRSVDSLGDSDQSGSGRNAGTIPLSQAACERAGIEVGNLADESFAPGPVNGFWGNSEWIECLDGKARPIEPGTFPLLDGVPQRVGRLRAYGNAIVPEVAAEVIRAFQAYLTLQVHR